MSQTPNQQQLLAQVKGIDLDTLIAAKGLAQRNLLENPTKANLQAFTEASKALNAATGTVQTDDGGRRFRTRAEALRHLQDKGYKIQKTKFYKDVEKNICHMQPDGSIMETALFRYVNNPASGLVQRDAVEDLSGENAEAERRKKDLEIEKLQIAIAHDRFKLEKEQGAHIPRADLEMEIISRAVALRATLKNWIHYTAARWIRLKTANQLIEDMEQGLDQALTDFANTKRFHVIFADDTDSTDLQDD